MKTPLDYYTKAIEELRSTRKEIQIELQTLRELQSFQTELQTLRELRTELQTVKTELQNSQAQTLKEIQTELGELKAEVRSVNSSPGTTQPTREPNRLVRKFATPSGPGFGQR